MSYPHRIRLRGPWQVEPLCCLEPGGALPAPLTMRLPDRLGAGALRDFRGRVRFRRPFGYPGRIDDHERVWLTLDGVSVSAHVELNGRDLGDVAGAGEFDVTAILQNRNKLLIDVDCAGPADGLWGDVALEVRATAFLRQVRFGLVGGHLEASGVVVGSADAPLDLYLLADNRCQSYQAIEPSISGQPFTLTAPWPDTAQGTDVRVELVHAATVWYVVTGTITPAWPIRLK